MGWCSTNWTALAGQTLKIFLSLTSVFSSITSLFSPCNSQALNCPLKPLSRDIYFYNSCPEFSGSLLNKYLHVQSTGTLDKFTKMPWSHLILNINNLILQSGFYLTVVFLPCVSSASLSVSRSLSHTHTSPLPSVLPHPSFSFSFYYPSAYNLNRYFMGNIHLL